MPTRTRSPQRYDWIDGRRPELSGKHGEAHLYAPAPGLAAVLEEQNVTLEALSELTGCPVDYLRRMRDEGQTAPRVVSSRIAAVLGVTTIAIRGEDY
jgi:hypothetical protein